MSRYTKAHPVRSRVLISAAVILAMSAPFIFLSILTMYVTLRFLMYKHYKTQFPETVHELAGISAHMYAWSASSLQMAPEHFFIDAIPSNLRNRVKRANHSVGFCHCAYRKNIKDVERFGKEYRAHGSSWLEEIF